MKMNDKLTYVFGGGYFITNVIFNVLSYKKNKKEVEKIRKINKMTENISERLNDCVIESSKNVREDFKKFSDLFDYIVYVFDLTGRCIFSSDKFSTRKEAEEQKNKLKMQYGKGYLVLTDRIIKKEE